MLISEISIKGYKSYGNNTQVLKLNSKTMVKNIIKIPKYENF